MSCANNKYCSKNSRSNSSHQRIDDQIIDKYNREFNYKQEDSDEITFNEKNDSNIKFWNYGSRETNLPFWYDYNNINKRLPELYTNVSNDNNNIKNKVIEENYIKYAISLLIIIFLIIIIYFCNFNYI